MSEGDPFRIPSDDAGDTDLVEPDDVQAVLAVLRQLAEQAHHPVVRACLEQAHEDIAHLTAYGDESPVDAA